MTFRVFNGVPSNIDLLNFAKSVAQPSHLCANRSIIIRFPHLAYGVCRIDQTLPAPGSKINSTKQSRFTKTQIEQRRWYGFWDFGDVMHTYDGPRHEWRYDVGGFAWANTELMPDLWLWYSFLRTGTARHLSHGRGHDPPHAGGRLLSPGPICPLGSRHNVQHWGDGAKELRISGALLHAPTTISPPMSAQAI